MSSSEDSEDTRRLVERVRSGETGAAEQLLAHHRAFLLQFVQVRLDPRMRPRVDPSDVVQEAQMEAHVRLANYLDNPVLPFRLWLRRLAFDRLLMLHRKHINAARRSVERDCRLSDQSSVLLAEQLLAASPSPSEEAVRRELTDRIHLALAQLPEVEREIIVMRNLEGLSNLEVAKVLNVDPATSSRRYGRSILRLREILSGQGMEEDEE